MTLNRVEKVSRPELNMQLESIPTCRLDLLKTEMSLLATKVSSVIDTLWKVRTASVTLWSAVLGVGLGSFSEHKQPVLLLLILSCLLPILFINIDARNNRWYRRLSHREQAIQEYLNDGTARFHEPFPIYDLAGKATFKNNGKVTWEFSLIRSLIDPIPLLFYGGQLIFSATACTIYTRPYWRWIFLPTSALTFCALLITARFAKKRLSATTPHSA